MENQENNDILQQQILEHLIQKLGPDGPAVTEHLLEHYCDFISPTQSSKLRVVQLRSGGVAGGSSRKLANLRINWKKLCCDASEGILTVAGAIAETWLIPFAALSVCSKLWLNCLVEVTPHQALSLVAMWRNCDKNARTITVDQARKAAYTLFRKHGMQEPGSSQFDEIIKELEKIGCIMCKTPNISLLEKTSL